MGKEGENAKEISAVKEDPTKGFFNKYSFRWIPSIVSGARRGEVGMGQMVLPPDSTSEEAYNKFNAEWEKAIAKGEPLNLRKILLRVWGVELMIAGLYKLLWSVCVIFGAFFFVKHLQLHVRDDPNWDEDWQGWTLAPLFFVDAYILGIALQRMSFGCMRVGVRVRAALFAAISRKSFGMASISQKESSDVVNFVASDLQKILEGIQEIHYLWTAPIEAGAILIILVCLVQEWSLPAWGVILVVIPLQYVIGYFIIKLKYRNLPNIQERASFFQELLPAMKLVKYYGWEKYFVDAIAVLRKRELAIYRKIGHIKTTQLTIVFGVPPVTALIVFSVYEMNVGKITSTLTFPILSLFNILRFPLVVLPKAMRAVSEMLQSLDRIEEFLKTEVATRGALNGAPGVVDISEAVLSHPTDLEGKFKLTVPEFSVKPGEVVAVVGRVGAGKTSLINAILGHMRVEEGSVSSGGRIAYVPQNCWVQNLTLRDSILFGEEYDEQRYDAVIHACALELDLQILPDSDGYMAGLRGINLSGGQRQRLNLARCAYAQSDLVLLDNALSAVDHHTAHHIFKHCFTKLMHDKAVVFVTHQVEFLPQCHKVAIMDGGDMLYFGPYNDLARELLAKVVPASHLLAAAGAAEQPRDPVNTVAKKPKKSVSKSALNVGASGSLTYMGKAKAERRVCLTTWEGIMMFYKESPCYGIIFWISLLIFMAAMTARQISDWWLSQWSQDTKEWYPQSVVPTNPPDAHPSSPFDSLSAGQAYIIVYAICVGLFVIGVQLRGWTFFWWAQGSGQSIHSKAVKNTMYAPLGFFLSNPVGELLLAFTRDQDNMDEQLMDNLHYLAIYGLIILATTITVSCTIYYFSIFGGILIIVTVLMLYFYLPAASCLKTLRTKTASEVVGLVAETLEGLNVIQAFKKTEYFVATASFRSDRHHSTVFTAESLNLWLAHYCDFYGSIMLLAVACFAVGMATTLGSGKVGLAFSNCIQLLVFYTWTVRFIAETLFSMSAVEKLGWLASEIPVEGKALNTPTDPSKGPDGEEDKEGRIVIRIDDQKPQKEQKEQDWPSRGVVQFENVWMKYSPTANFALKGVSFLLNHQDKVGVVGRTGSGKSTLLLALFRMFELDNGCISVDGVDISSITLEKLRNSLSIIPQEPVLFSGTVRSNLDPFNKHSDEELFVVLREASLHTYVESLGGLDAKVGSSGSGAWSIGQMQLMCLARAALRKVPVLCLDEATSALDPVSEQEVQAVIKRVFEERTIITIAHRLDTVIESDTVLVMEAGQLKESDSTCNLLNNPNSMFSLLVDKTGPEAAAGLRKMAEEYKMKKANMDMCLAGLHGDVCVRVTSMEPPAA